MIKSSSRIQLTDIILEVPIPEPTGPVIDVTPPEQPKSPPATPKADKGKGKVTNNVESLLKLLTEDEIHAHLDKEEKLEQAAKETRLGKPELIKVVQEEATKEEIASWDGGKSTWGGRARVFGTVSVCVSVQEMLYGGRGLLVGKVVKGELFGS
nr:hypothetical protein [Tanacetum cinerariifolium]